MPLELNQCWRRIKAFSCVRSLRLGKDQQAGAGKILRYECVVLGNKKSIIVIIRPIMRVFPFTPYFMASSLRADWFDEFDFLPRFVVDG